MNLAISIVGLVFVASGILLYGRDFVLSIRHGRHHPDASQRAASQRRFMIAVLAEIIGVVLLIVGGTFIR